MPEHNLFELDRKAHYTAFMRQVIFVKMPAAS